ncbi:MAG: transporter [Flavobacteriaceae bacterium]|nr:transporter [Flavobacteriaceae bacterium]
MKKQFLCSFAFALIISNMANAQEASIIQTLTPSKLIGKEQIDIKWFNNLYTQTKSTFSDGKEPRQNFFTSTLEVFKGASVQKRVNLGLILEYKSNTINDDNPLSVFAFKDNSIAGSRSGITSIAPSIKFQPFAKIGNFSVQSSFFIPLSKREVRDGVFLDQDGFTWQNRFYFDHTFGGNDWQLFAELNAEYHFGKPSIVEDNSSVQGSFANDSFNLTPGVFLSYFPSSKFTVLALGQYSKRLSINNNFEQDYIAVGGGLKYQLTKTLNIETLYTNFVSGSNTGLGSTFNLGLRIVK